MKTNETEATYFHINKPVKKGLQKIALYNHTSLSNLLEEGAKMIIHRESLRMREDMNDLNVINSMVRH